MALAEIMSLEIISKDKRAEMENAITVWLR